MKTLDTYKFEYAEGVTLTTLIGVIKNNFPLQYGNCFSVAVKDEKGFYRDYRIVNFVLENLKELLIQKKISWPVKILTISKNVGVIVDERIPEEWYAKKYCEICCPFDLLPHNQQMEYVRSLLRNEIQEFECENGDIIVKREIK